MLNVTLWHWLGFAAFVVVVLILDLAVFHRHSKETSLREAGMWTIIWCSMALAFNGLIWYWGGNTPALDFLTGYLIEWSLSMDNVFVFAVIFSFFKVPRKFQYRVLFWGIMGAIVMRLTFILIGAAMLKRFDWVMPVFGVFLIYTGVKLAMHDESQVDPDHNILMRLARKMFRVAREGHGEKFFVRESGKFCITPLFLVLLVVESTDVMFAVDSVPAIFAITKDPFIVFTSNIFAILGLRALYFLLAGVMDLFRYLSYGLSAVLVFVGFKMVSEYLAKIESVAAFVQQNIWGGFHRIEEGHHLIPSWVSLVVVVALLGISIVASLIARHRELVAAPQSPESPPPVDEATEHDSDQQEP